MLSAGLALATRRQKELAWNCTVFFLNATHITTCKCSHFNMRSVLLFPFTMEVLL